MARQEPWRQLDKKYYEKGNLKEESNYKDDKKNGIHKQYYESGELKIHTIFLNDEPDGKFTSYSKF